MATPKYSRIPSLDDFPLCKFGCGLRFGPVSMEQHIAMCPRAPAYHHSSSYGRRSPHRVMSPTPEPEPISQAQVSLGTIEDADRQLDFSVSEIDTSGLGERKASKKLSPSRDILDTQPKKMFSVASSGSSQPARPSTPQRTVPTFPRPQPTAPPILTAVSTSPYKPAMSPPREFGGDDVSRRVVQHVSSLSRVTTEDMVLSSIDGAKVAAAGGHVVRVSRDALEGSPSPAMQSSSVVVASGAPDLDRRVYKQLSPYSSKRQVKVFSF